MHELVTVNTDRINVRFNYKKNYEIKRDIHEVGCGDLGWIDLAQDRDR